MALYNFSFALDQLVEIKAICVPGTVTGLRVSPEEHILVAYWYEGNRHEVWMRPAEVEPRGTVAKPFPMRASAGQILVHTSVWEAALDCVDDLRTRVVPRDDTSAKRLTERFDALLQETST